MSNVNLRATWVFELEPDDASLVLKALGGRLRNAEEIQDAKELGDELTRIRAAAAKGIYEQMKKHADNIE